MAQKVVHGAKGGAWCVVQKVHVAKRKERRETAHF